MKSRNVIAALLFLQFMISTVMFLNLPVARQVVGFLYFTFIPGFIITKLLKMNTLDKLETILFSAGFSVAFLMFCGLFLNEFGFTLGIPKPLSMVLIIVILNICVLLCGLLACVRVQNFKFVEPRTLEASPFALLLTGLPILSILGAIWVNAFENNLILLFLIIVIALLVVVGLVSRKILPKKLYPFTVLMVAVSLLYHSSLISRYLVSWGSDVPLEYFVFKVTENNAHWSSVFMYRSLDYSRLNSMLSVTILPTTYSVLLNINATWTLKAVYPLIFSFVPLALYQLWRTNFGDKRALAGVFLLLAEATFYTEMLRLGRQMIGELFFVLLLLVLLNRKMKPRSKTICFITFSGALITSHYGLAEIFLLCISLAWIYLVAIKRRSTKITLTMICSFFVMMFAWYLYTSNSAVFDSFIGSGEYMLSQLNQFFSLESRGKTALLGLGMQSAYSIWNTFSRLFAYLTEFLIIAGFVGLIARRDFHLESEFFALVLSAMVFLFLVILVPGLAETFSMSRLYHVLLFFLAPLFVLGAEFLAKFVFKRKTELYISILLLIVLVPYFLFQTGFVYELTDTQSWSVPLSKHRMDAVFLYRYIGYSYESDVFGALWMPKNVDVKSSWTHADVPSIYNVLTSYGMIYRGNTRELSNATLLSTGDNVYLSRVNVVDGVVVGLYSIWNTSSVSRVYDFASKIYSNGDCEIYKNTADLVNEQT